MPAYDSTSFDPPAPLARVTLRDPKSGDTMSDVVLLLDTGADVTLLPQVPVNQLGVPLIPDLHYELMSFDGRTSFAAVVQLEMIFLNRVFSGQFLLINQERGTLGRDVINHLSLLLDGPRLTWLEQQSGNQ